MSRARTSVEARLRELLNAWDVERSPAALVALGQTALQRLLDSLEGKLDLWTGNSELEGREYDDARHSAVVAFARADLDSVLRALLARGWSETRIGLSGIGRVPDARVVPYVLSAFASKETLDRRAAMSCLAVQRDERAFEALIKALRDRSTSVRSGAIEALGELGDLRAIEALGLAAERSARTPWLARSAKTAIRKIRSARGKSTSPRAIRQ